MSSHINGPVLLFVWMARMDMVRGLELAVNVFKFKCYTCKNHRLFHAICYLFIKLKGVFASILNSENNGPVSFVRCLRPSHVSIETVSCSLFLWMARMDMVRGLKHEKFGSMFSSLNATPAMITGKIIMVIAPWWNLFDIFSA